MKKTDKKFYVYIILTVNNRLYCGYTDDVRKRYKMHCEGKAAKYTRANKPFRLVYVKEFNTKNEAMKEEFRIKKLTRKQKEAMFEMPVFSLPVC